MTERLTLAQAEQALRDAEQSRRVAQAEYVAAPLDNGYAPSRLFRSLMRAMRVERLARERWRHAVRSSQAVTQ